MKKIAIFPVLVIVLVISVSAKTETIPEAEQHFEKANELLKRMDYEAAIAEYGKVINLSSGSKVAQDAQYWIGQSHLRAGQFDAAQATFAKLIEQYPSSAIIPVTKLMVERVEQAKKDDKIIRSMSDAADKGFIIDSSTGVRYTKIATIAGRNDVIEFTNSLNLSPNGKFLLSENVVVSLDGNEPFNLEHLPAHRGSWSPNGTKIAFYSGDAICIVPVAPETGRPTGPVEKLLHGNYEFQTPVSWSPDGQKLAFTRRDKEHSGDIWILSVTDGSLTQLTNDAPEWEFAPQWSPDGKTIIYGMRKDRRSLWLVPAEGGTPTNILDSLGELKSFFWSRDGQWILYESNGIHLLNINSNQKLDIAASPREVGGFFSWSPDGKKMLFYRGSYGYRYGLKIVSSSGGPPLDIGKKIESYGAAVWSPDSKKIAIQGGDQDGNVVIWIIPLSGGDPVPLEIDASVVGKPFVFEVSPDGRKLAFVVKHDNGIHDLFVVPISLEEARTTGPAVKVFEGWQRRGGINAEASWSPDGSKLAIIHKNDLWMAPTDGGKPIQITATPEIERYPGWSPDSKMVHYIGFSKQQRQGVFYVRPFSGGKPTRILGAYRNSAWSPDSKNLAIISEGSILIVTTANGKTRQVAELKDIGLDQVFNLRWSPDGKTIACVGNHIEKGHAGPIVLVPAAGGKSTILVADDDSWKYSLSWSPDGKWITYDSQGSVKVRPEGTMWEADFDEILNKVSR